MTAVASEDEQPRTVTVDEATAMEDVIERALGTSPRKSTRPCQSLPPKQDCCSSLEAHVQRTDRIVWAVPEIPPCPLSAVTVPDLIAKMWELKRWAADPGFRMLERRTETLERRAGTCRALPHSTLHRAMTRQHMPRLEQLELFVRACGAEAHWYEWEQAWRSVDANVRATGKPRHR